MTETEAALKNRIQELEQKVVETPAHWAKIIAENAKLCTALAAEKAKVERLEKALLEIKINVFRSHKPSCVCTICEEMTAPGAIAQSALKEA